MFSHDSTVNPHSLWSKAVLTLPLPIVAICYLKCRVATNISHCLLSRWFKNSYLQKSVILISFWIYKYCFFFILSHFYHCAIFYSGCWIFSMPYGCQTVWIQIRPNILLGLIWIQTVCKGYKQTTNGAPSGQKVKYKTPC